MYKTFNENNMYIIQDVLLSNWFMLIQYICSKSFYFVNNIKFKPSYAKWNSLLTTYMSWYQIALKSLLRYPSLTLASDNVRLEVMSWCFVFLSHPIRELYDCDTIMQISEGTVVILPADHDLIGPWPLIGLCKMLEEFISI